MRRLIELLLVLVATTGISPAVTIYNATLTGGGWYTPSNTDAAVLSWTQTGTYTNVSVAADLATVVAEGFTPQFATANAFLTNQIGSGTTQGANEIASSLGVVSIPFYFNGDISDFGLVTFFSGLTLGPGTYYLVLNPTSADYTFSFALGASTIVTDSGVSAGADEFVNNGVGSYVPSWTFGPVAGGSYYGADVEGDSSAVPEPSTLLISGIGLVIIARLRRRR